MAFQDRDSNPQLSYSKFQRCLEELFELVFAEERSLAKSLIAIFSFLLHFCATIDKY